MPKITVRDLSYAFGGNEEGHLALNGINLEVAPSTRMAVLGANGSGKTTLLYHLVGLLGSPRGQIIVGETRLGPDTARKIRQRVGIIFENPDNQLISTTAYDDVAFGLRNFGWPEATVAAKVEQALERVQASDLAASSPYNLSWGQKKRVAMAGILAMEPEILVLDEPFSGLDPQISQSVFQLLEDLHSEGKTIIMAGHDVDLAYAWADEITVLSRGRVLLQGPPELLNDAELMERAGLDTPLLTKAFAPSPHRPRTAREARGILSRLGGGGP